jgi:hypothetical protein
MLRFLGGAIALSAGVLNAFAPAYAGINDRTLPMRFELHQDGPADGCVKNCATWVSATGAITADTPRAFGEFVQTHDMRGATLALDSDGGSVLGAIALGREIRQLNLATTVGHTADLGPDAGGVSRATLSPRADCESMCTFVLLAGVRRHVPAEARVMVHQIWLGDRREDPTAATYTAEDLVLVQRDIGRLAAYTSEMGGPSELLELALRIPPWEPMHALTRDELRRMRLVTDEAPLISSVAPPATSAVSASAPVTDGVRSSAISDRRWQVVDQSGSSVLARRHPLTIEGEEIGSFDLMVACSGNDGYLVSYVEKRFGSGDDKAAGVVDAVTLRAGGVEATLKVASSQRRADTGEVDTFASGSIPVALIKAFAGAGPHSLMVMTEGHDISTAIRLGNTGAGQNLPVLTASCSKSLNNRAELVTPKTGSLAAR